MRGKFVTTMPDKPYSVGFVLNKKKQRKISFAKRQSQDCVELEDLHKFMQDQLRFLNERERLAICVYFGIDRQMLPHSNSGVEMAKILGVSPERARQIREKGIRKLSSRLAIRQCAIDWFDIPPPAYSIGQTVTVSVKVVGGEARKIFVEMSKSHKMLVKIVNVQCDYRLSYVYGVKSLDNRDLFYKPQYYYYSFQHAFFEEKNINPIALDVKD